MGKSKDKKKQSSKPSAKVADLEPKKDPKGGKVAVHDISFVHNIDKASPNLMLPVTPKKPV